MGAEIKGRGVFTPTPPSRWWKIWSANGARVKTAPVAAIPVNPYFWSKSAEHDVTHG